MGLLSDDMYDVVRGKNADDEDGATGDGENVKQYDEYGNVGDSEEVKQDKGCKCGDKNENGWEGGRNEDGAELEEKEIKGLIKERVREMNIKKGKMRGKSKGDSWKEEKEMQGNNTRANDENVEKDSEEHKEGKEEKEDRGGDNGEGEKKQKANDEDVEKKSEELKEGPRR